jgi:hypothetical protein
LLDKPPGTGAQEAGIQDRMVVTSQLVPVLVWTNPSNGIQIEISSVRKPDIRDESKQASTKVTMSGFVIVSSMRDLMCSRRIFCRS